MSCILRASGKYFEVDLYTKDKDFEFANTYRKGDPKYPTSKPDGPKLEYSGLGIEVSSADFDEMNQQIDDSINFLEKNSKLVSELVKFKGVENAWLDFGVETKPPFFSSYTFPPELVSAAGKLGLSLCVSIYPCEEDEDET